MKVLFLQLVPNVGHIGEVKEVNDSYARNVLIPKGFAKKLTSQDEEKIKKEEKQKEAQRRNLIEKKHKIVESLNLKTIKFKAKVGENGKMFGSIGEHEIINKINKEFGIKLTRKHIDMPDGHIKKLGNEDIFIKLSHDSIAKLTIIVE